MVAELEYQQISSTSTQTSMPTVKPTATPWPTMAPPQPATFYVGFNNDRSPFDDRRVRQAFAKAIDRQALLDEIGWDSRLPATTFVPPEIWPDGRDLYGEVGLTFDPAKARALLDEAGRPSVVTVGYSAIDDDSDSLVRALVELLAVQWEGHLGVEINTLPIEREVYIGQLEMDAPQAYLLGWRADYDSPYNFLADVFRSDSPNNYAHYHNPAYDALLEEAILETDESTQLDMYMEAEWILCEDDAAIAPLYHYISYPDEP
jgi:oligopeptide transport system substrate-binding protein